MPREIYNVNPITEVTIAQVNRLVVELNTVLMSLSEQLATLEGRDGRVTSFSGDVDLGGKRIKNVGRTTSKMDVPNVEELAEKALYALGDRHVASRLIEAQGGIIVPRAESAPDAIPLEQLLEEIEVAIGDLVSGPATATDNAVARYNGVTGKEIQNSGVIIDDSDNITLPGDINHDGTQIGFNGIPPVVQSTGWNITNVTPDKTFDADLTTMNELADVLGTLINFLKSRGDLGA